MDRYLLLCVAWLVIAIAVGHFISQAGKIKRLPRIGFLLIGLSFVCGITLLFFVIAAG